MSTSGASTTTLVAAFVFGIVVNSALAAFFLHLRGHGGAVLRDGKRLVLAAFLLSAALWALIDFISITIDSASSASACQAGVIFSTFFDQLARFSVEQYLLWAVNDGAKAGMSQMLPQILIGVRFVLGGVFVGFSRPQFNPVCVPFSSIMPLAIIVLVLDLVIFATLAVRTFLSGTIAKARANESGSARSKSVLLVMAASVAWTAMSVVLVLGMKNVNILLRTLLPSIGLLGLILLVTVCNEPLTTGEPRAPRAPESPGVRDISTGQSTLTANSTNYPPQRYEDLKRADIVSMTAFERPREAPQPELEDEAGNLNASLARTDSSRQPQQPLRAKRSLFSANRMVISNPILQSNGDQNPLNKIATISLEDAVQQEKERRANMLLRRDSSLIAKRPAPQPPNTLFSGENGGVMRTVSLKRKEVATSAASVASSSPQAQPPLPTTTTDRLEPMSSAFTSSSQLSPNSSDDVRRRSPRQPDAASMASPPTTPPSSSGGRTSSNVASTATFGHANAMSSSNSSISNSSSKIPPPLLGLSNSVRRNDIRPSRQLTQPSTRAVPASAPAPPPEPTALQKRPALGLPKTPKSMPLKVAMSKELPDPTQQQKTIMFVNSIVYDNPEAVQNIIDGVSNNSSDWRTSKSAVVNRPRPIPRNGDEDHRAIFPTEAKPHQAGQHHHSRSRSGGSILSRKSIVRMPAGSPTQLPPLPPPPPPPPAQMKMAGTGERPLPNNTKSMTFDEKMTLMFPTPPSQNSSSSRRRRSSVPELPSQEGQPGSDSAPSFMRISVSPTSNYDGLVVSRFSTTSSRTARTSVRTEAIFVDAASMNELPAQRGGVEERRRSNESEAAAATDAADAEYEADAYDDWLPEGEEETIVIRNDTTTATNERYSSRPSIRSSRGLLAQKRASSPVLPLATGFSDMGMQSDDDGPLSSNVSTLSPVVAMATQSRQAAAARSVYYTKTVGQGKDAAKMPVAAKSSWHRRVGDDCPSFSSIRTEKDMRTGGGKMRMPPPTPLRLGPVSTKNPMVIKAAEPSPLESPEQALAMIQAQLQKFKEANAAAMAESPSQRLALLQNLEDEMNAQEGYWQDMRNGLGRDSLSSMPTMSAMSMSRGPSMIGGAGAGSNRAVLGGHDDANAARRSLLSILNNRRRDVTSIATTAASPIVVEDWSERTGDAAAWKGMLDMSGMAYQHNNNMMPRKSPLSFVGSPTPPDSDNEMSDDDERSPMHLLKHAAETLAPGIFVDAGRQQKASVRQLLWHPAVHQTTISTSLLWAPKPKMPVVEMAATLFGDVPTLRSSTRKSVPDLKASLITEAFEGLWQRQEDEAVQNSGVGLWKGTCQGQSEMVEAQVEKKTTAKAEPTILSAATVTSQKKPRPLTQRPARQSKRITVLPDIIENPEPLPNKRGTLGIFQFPWGERSDMATYQPPPPPPRTNMFMAMPGTMTSGGQAMVNAVMEERSRQLELDEYTSSFFDDYDDDELEAMAGQTYDDSDDEDGSDSDDGFDETTLWEIASLLKSDNVPSKMSLLPPPLPVSSSVLEDYVSEYPSDEDRGDGEDEQDSSFQETLSDHSSGDDDSSSASSSSPSVNSPRPALWAKKATEGAKVVAVAQPDAATWKEVYDNVVQTAAARSAKSVIPEPLPITTDRLWESETMLSFTSSQQQLPGLWEQQREIVKTATSLKGLWTPLVNDAALAGQPREAQLFDLSAATAMKSRSSAVRRTTSLAPAAIDMERRARALRLEPLEELMSTSLWAPTTIDKKLEPKLWTPLSAAPMMMSSQPMLFDCDAAALLQSRGMTIRTTDKEPAALHMERAPRAVLPLASLEKLTSTSLWAAQALTDSRAAALTLPSLWVSKPVRREAPAPKQLLWTSKPAMAVPEVPIGLFDISAPAWIESRAKSMRTTDLEATDVATLRTQRPSEAADLAPLKIVSSSLWTPPTRALKKNMLWTAKPAMPVISSASQTGLFDHAAASWMKSQGIVIRTSDKEPAALYMERSARPVNHDLPLEKLQSTSLWALRQQAQLWVAKPAMPVFSAGQSGLFDGAAASRMRAQGIVIRTSDEEPAALLMERSTRPVDVSLPLEELQSTSLWRAPRPQARLWAAKRPVLISRPDKAELFNAVAASLMRAEGIIVRTSNEEPAAMHMERSIRPVNVFLPLETLESNSLWAPRVPRATGPQLWTAKTAMPVFSAGKSGLFDRAVASWMRTQGITIRTSDKEPAALNMSGPTVHPMKLELPLEKLTSTRLWTVGSKKNEQQQRLWSARFVPTVTTKTLGVYLFDADAQAAEKLRQPVRTTDQEPAALDMTRAPRSLSAVVDSLSMAPLESTELWSLSSLAKQQRNWILAGSLRRVVSDAEWESALQQAVEASYPRRARISASPEAWQSALAEAMARSQAPFDDTKQHPALAGFNAKNTIFDLDVPFDAAKMHPVFFRPSTASAVEEERQENTWETPAEASIMAQIEQLEREREFAAAAAQQQFLVVASSSSKQDEDRSYQAHIAYMESEAMARLQALEGAGGVVLRY